MGKVIVGQQRQLRGLTNDQVLNYIAHYLDLVNAKLDVLAFHQGLVLEQHPRVFEIRRTFEGVITGFGVEIVSGQTETRGSAG